MPAPTHPLLSACAATLLLVAAASEPALADDSRTSQIGETCSRSADCAGELRCVAKTCVAPGTAAAPAPAPGPLHASYPDPAKRKSAITFLGVGGGVAALGLGLLIGGFVVDADFQDKLDQVVCEGKYTEQSGNCENDFNVRQMIAGEAETLETTRDALYVTGALAMSAGIALMITGGVKLAQSRRGGPPPVSLSPWTDGQSLVGAQASLRF